MKIIWTDRSLKDLDEIFRFYYEEAGFEVSQRIISTLVNKVEILTTNWNLGQIQFFELPVKYKYRYLIEGNHKIIYRVDEVKNQILIARVFDTRRDPSRLKI